MIILIEKVKSIYYLAKLTNMYEQKIKKILESTNMRVQREKDFIIHNVHKYDIDAVLSDQSKQYFILRDKTLFNEELPYSCGIRRS